MSPSGKGYTDIYVILTYTSTETRVVWVIYKKNHFFGQGLKFNSPLRRLTF